MSLKHLADELAAKGRYGDTELVHMTKREVAGLQALAEAAGGTLTTNPKTGLPEASFLERLLPSIIGLGVGMFAGPMAGAAAGALVGGATNEENPMMGALMGGLGGYGGATLGAGLNTAGTSAAQAVATPVAETAANQALNTAASNTMGASASGLPFTGAEADVIRNQAMGDVYRQAGADFASQPFYSRFGEGIQALGDAGGRTAFMQDVGGYGGLAKAGIMGLAPTLMPEARRPLTEEGDTDDVSGRYTYDAGYTGGTREPGTAFTGERRFFNPRFIRNAAQGGAVKKYADGGEMSAPSSDFDPARGMTGASAEAMRYLYGMQDESPALRSQLEAAERLRDEPVRVPAGAPKPAQSSDSPFAAMLPFLPGVSGQGSLFTRAIAGGAQQSPGTLYRQVDAGYDFDPQTQRFTKRFEYQPYVPTFVPSPSNDYGFAEGGITDLARGGMKAGGFVVPADVVSMVGEGNTDAGYERIRSMIPGATAIKGKDGGQADTVETSIEGKQPARVAHGEMYVPPAAVKRAGGAKKLYAMMKNVRKQAKGDAKQIKPVDLRKAMA